MEVSKSGRRCLLQKRSIVCCNPDSSVRETGMLWEWCTWTQVDPTWPHLAADPLRTDPCKVRFAIEGITSMIG